MSGKGLPIERAQGELGKIVERFRIAGRFGSDEEALGVLVARCLDWDSLKIIRATVHGLNYAECPEEARELAKLVGGLGNEA